MTPAHVASRLLAALLHFSVCRACALSPRASLCQRQPPSEPRRVAAAMPPPSPRSDLAPGPKAGPGSPPRRARFGWVWLLSAYWPGLNDGNVKVEIVPKESGAETNPPESANCDLNQVFFLLMGHVYRLDELHDRILTMGMSSVSLKLGDLRKGSIS